MFYKILSVIMGILLIIGGICCVATPISTYAVLPDLMGIAMMVEGIGCIIAWANLKAAGEKNGLLILNGILSVILGIVVVGSDLIKLDLAITYIYFAAAWMLVSGVFRIVDAFKIRKLRKEADGMPVNNDIDRAGRSLLQQIGGTWWVFLIIGILSVIAGFMSFDNPLSLAIAIGTIMGIDVIVSGVDLITLSFMNL